MLKEGSLLPINKAIEEPGDLRETDSKNFSPTLAPYVPMAEEFIRFGQGLFNLQAGNPDPPLEFFLSEQGFFFNHQANKVGIDLNRFKEMKEKGFKQEQILFAVSHEIQHYLDMTTDPEAYLKNLQDNMEIGQELAPQVKEIWIRRFPEQAETIEKINIPSFVEKNWHDLFNCLDDVYVNRAAVNDAAIFQGQAGQVFSQDVVDLYRKHLFPNQGDDEDRFIDYSKLPRSRQFMYSLLRGFMVKDEMIIVSPDVKEKLHSFIDKYSRQAGHDLTEEAIEMCRPTSRFETKNHGVSARHDWIRRFVEPHFRELFFKDMEDQKLPKLEDGQSGGNGEGQNGEGDPWSNPEVDASPLDEAKIKEYILDRSKKKREAQKQKKTAQKEAGEDVGARLERGRKERNYQAALEAGLEKSVVDEYERLRKKLEPYRRELSRVFEQVMENIAEKISQEWIRYARKGKFNPESFIDKYGELLASGRIDSIPFDKLDVYDRQEFTRKLILFPNRIRFRLIGDGSGSMNGENIEEERKLCILIIEALKDFEYQTNLRFRMDKPFQVDTQVVMFGSEGRSTIAKDFDSRSRGGDRQIERYRAVEKINASYGNTHDDEVWEMIDEDIDYSQDLQEGKVMELCFEITDGASDTESVTRGAIDKVEKKGVKVLGFLLGEDGKETFDKIWNDGQKEARGFQVREPGDLARIISERFAQEMRKREIKVLGYGDAIGDN